jgi:uncharacterized Tic20 family protein
VLNSGTAEPKNSSSRQEQMFCHIDLLGQLSRFIVFFNGGITAWLAELQWKRTVQIESMEWFN